MRITRKTAGLGIALAFGITGITGGAALAAEQDQDQLRDQTCVEECDQQQDRDQLGTHDQTRDQTQLQDGSCGDGPAGSAVQKQTRAHNGEQGVTQAGATEQARHQNGK